MKLLIYLLISLLGWNLLWGQQDKKQWEAERRREKQLWEEQNKREWEAWQRRNIQERQLWQDMVDRESAEWQKHVQEVRKLWQKVRFSDVRNWVGYGPNKSSRFHADFVHGTLTIEVLGAPNASESELQQKALEIFRDVAETPSGPHQPPILDKQLSVDPNISQIPSSYMHTDNYVAPMGKRFQRLTINIPFREDHLRIRAQMVAPIVQKYCQKYGVNPRMVMAIIHTESSFNPRAISTFRRGKGGYGHAYGLMQLVPEYGGQEAYTMIGGRGLPSPALLFDPDRNIELGVVYLAKLTHQYFGGVQGEEKKEYLTIAGYNTGPFNVAKAFNPRSDLQQAIPFINRMTARKVYQHLLTNLPIWETREYLQKVVQRMALY